jgi:hypothetical protein
MSRNSVLVLVALIGLVVCGAGGGYWAYKKIQKKRNQEFRCEMKMSVGEQFDLDRFKKALLADDILEPVIESKGLVSLWGVPDIEAAKVHMRKKLQVKMDEGKLRVSFQGKNKEKVPEILKAVLDTYQKKINAAQSQ